MSLGRLLRRASSKASDLLTFNPAAGGASLRSGLDGEIIFSKNNVCVHPAEPLPGLAEHHPGKEQKKAKVFSQNTLESTKHSVCPNVEHKSDFYTHHCKHNQLSPL